MQRITLHIESENYQELFKDFALRLEQLGYAKESQKQIRAVIREFLNHQEQQCRIEIQEIEPQDINDYYHYLETRPNRMQGGSLSQSTINFHIYALKLFFRNLLQDGLIEKDPFGVLHFPGHQHKERQVLSTAEITKLYQVSENLQERALLGLLYGCGLRIKEAIKLNIGDLKLKEKLLYIREGKGKKRRVVPIGTEVVKDFKDYYYKEREQTKTGAFMLNGKGKRMLYGTYMKILKRMAEDAKLEKRLSPHVLRHSIATHLLWRGMDIEKLRDFLGHGHLETTQLYTRIKEQ